MVVETEPVIFFQWLGPASLIFLIAVGVIGLIAIAFVGCIALFRHSPAEAGDVVFGALRTAGIDLSRVSPQRISALAWLAVKEAIRRRVVVVLALFLLILAFTGWFLDTTTNDPSTLYLDFMMTATKWLLLVIVLVLSAFSLPLDVKNRTLYTIVTKPVRPGEIVLGRILGFTFIGTVLLAVMGAGSYVFIIRVLDHTHQVEMEGLKSITGSDQKVGRTTPAHGHRHQVTLDADGSGSTDIAQGHWHVVHSAKRGDKTESVLGPPQGVYVARVPLYGKLRFLDSKGQGKSKGINVGNEWTYRSFVEGGSLAAAIWTFHDVTPENFPDGLPLEMTIRVFRTYKGQMDKGILGSLVIRNPSTGRSSAIETFRAKDYYIDRRDIPRKLKDSTGQTIDLFDDLVADGNVEVWLQCLEPSQYYGVAQADLYLRANDASFTWNFVKGYLGIWFQMVLVIGFGVMFSTFLSGPVAMMATVAALVLGVFTKFVLGVASGEIQGGGPVESFIRIVRQDNVTMQMEPGASTTIVKAIDAGLMGVMEQVVNVLPDFSRFDNVVYVSHGFDIRPDLVLVQGAQTLAYLVFVFVVGYFFLKTREVAR